MRSVLALAGWLALSFAAAALGGYFLAGGWSARVQGPSHYERIFGPVWRLPNWLFGPIWMVHYAMMAIGAWLVWRRGGFAEQRLALSLFVLQLLFNALWSPLFFGLENPALALVDIVLLWFALLATVAAFRKARLLAGVLLYPYLVWVTCAGVFNLLAWVVPRLVG